MVIFFWKGRDTKIERNRGLRFIHFILSFCLEKSTNKQVMKKQFMVELELPEVFDEKLIALIPKQRSTVNQMLAKGKIKSYSLSMDRSMLWAIFVAESEFEVLEMIAEFPLADYMTPYITELMFTNTENQVLQFSLN